MLIVNYHLPLILFKRQVQINSATWFLVKAKPKNFNLNKALLIIIVIKIKYFS